MLTDCCGIDLESYQREVDRLTADRDRLREALERIASGESYTAENIAREALAADPIQPPAETERMSDRDPLGTLIRVVEEILDAFDKRGEYSLPDGDGFGGPDDLGLRLEEAYRALPSYRQGDEIECPQCQRHRMQVNGVCEKCGWHLSWNSATLPTPRDGSTDPKDAQDG